MTKETEDSSLRSVSEIVGVIFRRRISRPKEDVAQLIESLREVMQEALSSEASLARLKDLQASLHEAIRMREEEEAGLQTDLKGSDVQQLATIYDVSPQTIRNLLNGSDLSGRVLRRIVSDLEDDENDNLLLRALLLSFLRQQLSADDGDSFGDGLEVLKRSGLLE